MNELERDMMLGMINILNIANKAYYNSDTPIMNDEQYNIRLKDLQELEEETGVMFVNSPNCKSDVQSIIKVEQFNKDSLKECKDASEIIKYFNQNEMAIYLDINGSDIVATYVDGYLTDILVNDINIKEEINSAKIPYKIKKDGVYTIKGKLSSGTFYVSDILKGECGNLRDNLSEAKELNFDIAPLWFANGLSSKKIQETIDYVFDYIIEEENLDCNGIIFKFNEKKLSNVLNFVGCYYSNDNNNNNQ